jgi:non-specific serine/threonine protein kinase
MVSHYRIVEKIGAGGMGEVYLAEDTKLKRKVALKFLPSQFAADSDFKARFVREAEATAKLDHPNIVTIYEVSEFQGRPFFAMQLVEGQSLR